MILTYRKGYDIIELMQEIFKSYPLNSNYKVSNLGRVKSLPRKVRIGNNWRNTDEKILKDCNSGLYEYRIVHLGRGARKYVHRMVLETFVGNCPKGMECLHLDGDNKNNKLDNLKWGTHSDNELMKFLDSKNTSGYRGVAWSSRHNKWIAAKNFDGKKYVFGMHQDPYTAFCMIPKNKSEWEKVHKHKARGNNTTGYRGVVLKPNGKYIAQWTVNGTKKYFGTNHKTAEAAYAAIPDNLK